VHLPSAEYLTRQSALVLQAAPHPMAVVAVAAQVRRARTTREHLAAQAAQASRPH
jgi:hypothetical protein